MITFLLGGLWHGAGWTFVFWGFLHGMALAIHRVWSSLGFKIWTWLAWLITFNFVNIAWVFFRAKEWDDAIKVLKGMFFGDLVVSKQFANAVNYLNPLSELITLRGGEIQKFLSVGSLWMIVLGFVLISLRNSNSYKELNYSLIVLSSLMLIVSLFKLVDISEFLYFNF